MTSMLVRPQRGRARTARTFVPGSAALRVHGHLHGDPGPRADGFLRVARAVVVAVVSASAGR